MEKLNFIYRGVVEDNNDPEDQGRCRVRILGIHSPKLTDLRTDELPWCEKAGELFCGIMQGIGISSVPVNGTWVWVFFERGELSKPVYFASAAGGQYSEFPSQTSGFRDSNLYETNDVPYKYPRSNRMSHTDFNRLCTAKELEYTIHKVINDNRMSAGDIVEPESTSNYTRYPYNNVIETQAGHVLEFDDTKDNERIRLFHKSGSYEEVKPNGDRVERTNGTYYILTAADLKEIVAGEVKRVIGSNLSEYIKGNVELNVDGNLSWNVNGEIRFKSGSDIIYKGSTIQLNPTFGFADSKLKNLDISYNQTQTIIPSPPMVTYEVDQQGNVISTETSTIGDEIVDQGEEKPAPEESPVSDECVNPWDIAYTAFNSIGQAGWKENGSNKNILALWEEAGIKCSTDKTPWCAVFLTATLKRAKCKYVSTASSQAYKNYGIAVNSIAEARIGDILVYTNPGGSTGHVALYNGQLRGNYVGSLGGNQSDTLKVSNFNKDGSLRLAAIRRPVDANGVACPAATKPVITSTDKGGNTR